jgi:hypothetical protein
MRRIESLSDFLRNIDDRKRALGITDETIVGARNTGERGTPAKRQMLARIQERARRAFVEPLAADFGNGLID